MNDPRSARRSVTAVLLATSALSIACGSTNHYVLASSGTVIGVELSQDPANQSPQGKLGYNRSEIALVPTNRPTCLANDDELECSTQQGNGAADTTDVLMELRYQGIFSFTANGGIYQRLAVGNTAVRQPGATLLFARSNAGSLGDSPEAAVAAAVATPTELAERQLAAIERFANCAAPGGKVDAARIKAAFAQTGRSSERAEKLAGDYSGMERAEFIRKLKFAYPYEAEALARACHTKETE